MRDYSQVEQVIQSKEVGRKHKSKMYLVRWKGFGPEDDTWEPSDSLEDVQAVIDFETEAAAKESVSP